jgi:hypothetical protein
LPVLRGFSRNVKQDSEGSTATVRQSLTLPVLRGFSRNVKQDSKGSNATGGVRQSLTLPDEKNSAPN